LTSQKCTLPRPNSLLELTLKRGEASVEDQLEITKLTLIEDNGRQLLGLFNELLATGSIASDEVLEDTT
jgi:hypothetical protein